jgi:hypothetical protein
LAIDAVDRRELRHLGGGGTEPLDQEVLLDRLAAQGFDDRALARLRQLVGTKIAPPVSLPALRREPEPQQEEPASARRPEPEQEPATTPSAPSPGGPRTLLIAIALAIVFVLGFVAARLSP